MKLGKLRIVWGETWEEAEYHRGLNDGAVELAQARAGRDNYQTAFDKLAAAHETLERELKDAKMDLFRAQCQLENNKPPALRRVSLSDVALNDGFQVQEENPLWQSVMATIDEEIEYFVTAAGDFKIADKPGSITHLLGGVAAVRATRDTLESRRLRAMTPAEDKEAQA